MEVRITGHAAPGNYPPQWSGCLIVPSGWMTWIPAQVEGLELRRFALLSPSSS